MFIRKNKRTLGRQFSLQQLESRQLMAADVSLALDGGLTGDEPATLERTALFAQATTSKMTGNITAMLSGGNLYLNEAKGKQGLNQGVTISQLPNGNILLTGHDPTNSGGTGSLINGLPSVEFAVPGSLFVNLGGGEDQVVFDTSAGAVPSFHDAVLDMGADGAVDRVIIWGLHTRGSLNVNTGGGDDWVFLSGSVIGDNFGGDAFTVNSGAGADTVTVKNGTQIMGRVDIQTYGTLAETDADVVYFDTEAYVDRNVDIRTGGGDDLMLVTKDYEPIIYFGGLTVSGSLNVDLGAGNDTAFLRAIITLGNFSVNSGAGADNLTIDNRPFEQWEGGYFIPRVGGNLDVQTYAAIEETDRDEVRILDGIVDGSLLARLGGGDDYFLMDDAEIIFNDLNLEMGAGNDEAEISAYVVDHLMAWMGEGADTLRLGKTWAYRLIADGNLGSDSLTTAYDTQALYKDLLGWEQINGIPTWLDDIVYDFEDGGVLAP